jgi:hypothetical protein
MNGECPHPKATLVDIPGQPGRFKCGLCGVTGSIMTRSEGGILTPKVWK